MIGKTTIVVDDDVEIIVSRARRVESDEITGVWLTIVSPKEPLAHIDKECWRVLRAAIDAMLENT